MPGLPLVISNPVRASLHSFTREERREIRRLLGLIQLDPSIDGVRKIVAPRPPAIFTAYVSPQFWIFYRVHRNVIIIDDIERATGPFPVPW